MSQFKTLKFCIAEPCSQIKNGLNGKTGVFSFSQAAEFHMRWWSGTAPSNT